MSIISDLLREYFNHDITDESADEIERLEAELSERDARIECLQEWRPISTAPLDGSFIQLYRPDTQVVGY